MIATLPLDYVKEIHRRAIDTFGGSPGVRDEGLIQSALARPLAGFGEHEAYPTLPEKAAVLAVGLCKNHGFIDGNKRVAFGAMTTLLAVNGYDLVATADDQVQTMLSVADGSVDELALAGWIGARIVPLARPLLE